MQTQHMRINDVSMYTNIPHTISYYVHTHTQQKPLILTVVGGERQTEFEPGSRALSPCPRQPESVPYPAKIVSRHTERKEQTNSDT